MVYEEQHVKKAAFYIGLAVIVLMGIILFALPAHAQRTACAAISAQYSGHTREKRKVRSSLAAKMPSSCGFFVVATVTISPLGRFE
jgi:hypothetical protein